MYMPSSIKEKDFFFFFVPLFQIVTTGKRQGHHLNKLGRGPPGDVTCYKALCLPVSMMNNFDVSFFFFPYMYVPDHDPVVRGRF